MILIKNIWRKIIHKKTDSYDYSEILEIFLGFVTAELINSNTIEEDPVDLILEFSVLPVVAEMVRHSKIRIKFKMTEKNFSNFKESIEKQGE